MRYHDLTRPLDSRKPRMFCESHCVQNCIKRFFGKLFKNFMYFCMKFTLFRFFDSWYIIKYLLTETSGQQYVLWTLDCRCFPRLRLGKHRQSRVHKTYCFPRSQSISVNYFFICARLELFCDFLQFDWLHERAALYDILARGPKELFFLKQTKE